MRKISFKITAMALVIIAMSLAFNSCKKTEEEKVPGCTNPEAMNYNADANEDDGSCLTPEQKQRTIVINYTGTWCGPCGSYGIPAFVNAYTTYPNDVVPLKVNLSDDLECTTGTSFASAYGISAIPTFYVGDAQVSSTSINSTVASQITATAVAGATGKFSVSGNTATVQTQVKFFSAVSGDYYLAVYLMESGISANQNGASTNPTIHNHVLRGNIAGTSAFGESIVTGSATAGKIINKTYTATLTSGWNSANMYASFVIWKKNGSTYNFVNAWQTKAN